MIKKISVIPIVIPMHHCLSSVFGEIHFFVVSLQIFSWFAYLTPPSTIRHHTVANNDSTMDTLQQETG
jgi:hypothetical protein